MPDDPHAHVFVRCHDRAAAGPLLFILRAAGAAPPEHDPPCT
jgi:hypothetical protein